MKVYSIGFPQDSEEAGKGVVELFVAPRAVPPNGVRVEGWEDVEGRLKAEPLRDYMPSCSLVAGRAVCSLRLKSYLAARCPNPDYVQWLPCSISSSSGRHDFFVMHFAGAVEVLDLERTEFLFEDWPTKLFFRPEIVSRYPFFARAGYGAFEFYAREDLKRELQAENFTGLVFNSPHYFGEDEPIQPLQPTPGS